LPPAKVTRTALSRAYYTAILQRETYIFAMSAASACARCGTPVAPGARACISCGADVSGQQGLVATAYLSGGDAGTLSAPASGLIEALRRATAGEYDVGGELGAGGMATVYLAHDLALGRKVAIKVMSPALLAMPGMVERFKREARTAASLSHPHIIPIFAVKQSAEVVFFVMKFVEGRSLESIIRAAGPLPVPLAQAVLYEAAAALEHAHRAGVVHRDVKPANIMVDRDGWVVVTDFGIAKVAETTGLTMTGATIGTPSYMSPEQCEAKRDLTGASDQYSLGIVAYEMLTGAPPFRADTTLGLLYAHVHEPPPPVGPEVPLPVATALMRMLEKDPASRFADVAAAAADMGGGPIASDDPVREQLRQLARASGTADLARIARTPVSPVPTTRRPASRTAEPRPAATRAPAPRPRSRLVWGLGLGALVAIGATAALLMRRTPPAAPVASTPPRPAPSALLPPETVRIQVPAPAEPAPPQATRTPPDRPLPVAEDPRARRRFNAGKLAALGLRARARSRGATEVDLAAGDALLGRADSLARAGDFAAASELVRAAQRRWFDVQRPGNTRPLSTPDAGETVGADRRHVEDLVAAFADAFRSRDLSRVRRVYPAMTPQQAQDWGTFFLDAGNLDVRLAVTSLDARAAEVLADVTGGLDWESVQTGRAESRAVSYRARFARSEGGLRLVGLR
jgi:serine/threonine-protein kinase